MSKLFIAVGDDFSGGANATTIITSPDGAAWTQQTLPAGITTITLTSVCACSTYALAIGSGAPGTNAILKSTDGISWAKLTPPASPADLQLLSVGCNDTFAVAVGLSSSSSPKLQVFSSTDAGATWSPQTLPGGFSATATFFPWVTVNATLAIITINVAGAGPALILTSPDGATWTQRTANPTTFCNFFASGATSTEFIVAGSDDTGAPLIETSPTGVTWTKQTTSSGAGFFFQGLWAEDTLQVAVGGNFAETNPVIESSTNTSTWNSQTPNPSTGAFLTAVTFNGLVWCAVGADNTGLNPVAMTSPDGTTWSPQTTTPSTNVFLRSITALSTSAPIIITASLVDALTANDALFSSGSTLSISDILSTTDAFAITCPIQVASGTNILGQNFVFENSRGVPSSWNTVTPGLADVMQCWYGTYGGGLFVFVGTEVNSPFPAAIATSPDGMNWTLRSNSFGNGGQGFAAAYSVDQSLYMVGGFNGSTPDAGHIETSTDGITWTPQVCGFAGPKGGTVWGVEYGNGIWVAVGETVANNGQIQGAVQYSTNNGVTWNNAATDFSGHLEVRGVAFGNGIFVIVQKPPIGSAPPGGFRIFTSTDGNNWTQQFYSPIHDPEDSLLTVAFGNGTFVAGGLYKNGGAATLYSTDGIHWTASSNLFSSPTAFVRTAVWTGSMFLIGGSDGSHPIYAGEIEFSPDGINWVGAGGVTFGAVWGLAGKTCAAQQPFAAEPEVHRKIRDPWDCDEWGRFQPGACIRPIY